MRLPTEEDENYTKIDGQEEEKKEKEEKEN